MNLISLCHNFSFPDAFGATTTKYGAGPLAIAGYPRNGLKAIAVHGYNNSEQASEQSYGLLQAGIPEVQLTGLIWPGETKGILFRLAIMNADVAAFRLQDILTGQDDVDLETHSLGARVALGALNNGAVRGGHLIITAPAVDDICLQYGGEFTNVPANCKSLNLFISRNDPVLKLDYPIGTFGHQALGLVGPRCLSTLPVNVRVFDCSRIVTTHGGYRYRPEFFDAWRSILNGTAKPGLTIL